MNKKLMVTVTILFAKLTVWCQVNAFTKTPDATVFKNVNNQGWVKFQDNLSAEKASLFTVYQKAFGLGNGYSMQVKKLRQDDLGFTHTKLQQLYNNIVVTGGEFIIHEKNGRLFSGNGKIVTPATISSAKNISEQTALQRALQSIAAVQGYYWQDARREAALKKKTGNTSATYYPRATLAYLPAEDSTSMVLCYRFFIKALDFGKSATCYVNAATGKLEQKIPADYNCDPTTFTSTYNGVQTLFTNDVGVLGNSYDMEDDCQASVYTVYDNTKGDAIFNSANNQWTTAAQRSAATSLWVIKASFYWFKTFFGRNGHDNDDGDLDIYQGVNFGTSAKPNYNNASYSYDEFGIDEIKVGTGNEARGTDDYNTMDILAHEFTHGVTQFEANLVYLKESGALNESFSDIFGEWIENKVFGSNDWYMGAEMLSANTCPNPARSLIDPGGQNVAVGACVGYNFNQPNTIGGANWIVTNPCTPIGPNQTGDNDWCGVHANSGVQNQMFYLLSAGGTGWNDGQTCHAAAGTGTQWSVSGISIDKAIRIAYRVLCDYLVSTSNYADARNAWVHAAADLYGECSFEAIQTGRAWSAVGINPPVTSTTVYAVCNDYGTAPVTIRKNSAVDIASGCTVSILPTGNLVTVEARQAIHIYPGFRAASGSYFRAAISDECRFAQY